MPSLVEDAALVAAARPQIVREPWLAERVVFVGGHPGCGKTMLTPIIGAFERVEMQKYNYTIEHLCGLHLLGRLDDDIASSLIRMQVDTDLYNLMMSREVNLRPTDLSGAFQNPNPWRYLRRLVQPGDAAVAQRIARERPILHLTTHNALAISAALFVALGDRLRIIEVVRHPLYMIKQWERYILRYGTDVRDFTVWIAYDGQALPFFAASWEAEYLAANAVDRCILAIRHLTQLGERALQRITDDQRRQVLMLPFERFVLDPEPSLADIERLLDTRVTRLTRRELRRQRVPRQRIADGVSKVIYRQYGWQPAQRGANERHELAARRAYVAERASSRGLEVLDELSRAYEARYWPEVLA